MPARDTLVHGLLGDVLAAEDDVAGVGAQESADQVHQRGLAGAVGADQRQHLALLHPEVHVIDGAELAELLEQAPGLEQYAHFALHRAHRRSAVPTIPVGSESTRTTRMRPSSPCQYTV